MALDWGDAPAWAGVVLSVLASLVAVWAVVEARRNRRAAERSAEAAEKSYQLAEQQYRDSLPPAVAWRIESTRKEHYVLRNTGTDAAHNVTVDRDQLVGVLVTGAEPPLGATIPPDGRYPFMLSGGFGARVPNEVWVTWEGHPTPVPVPLPVQ